MSYTEFMTREQQFADVTKLLLNYDSGDFMLLSDIADAVSLFTDFFLEQEEPYTLIQWLLNLIRVEMNKSGQPDFIGQVTQGMDLLQRLTPSCTLDEAANLKNRMLSLCKPAQNPETKATVQGLDDESFQIFLTEAIDRLAQAQSLILALEDDFSDLELVNKLFRVFHTIKGECGFLKIASLGELTHNIENLLDLLRSKKLEPNPEIIDVLLEGLDMSRKIVDKLKVGDYVVFNDVSMESYFLKLGKIAPQTKVSLGDILVSEGKLKDADVVRILQKQKESSYTKKFGEIAVMENYLSSQELRDTLGKQEKKSTAPPLGGSEPTDPIIKVRASKVNFLVDMIGELLISMGQITENTPAVAQMRKITRSIQFGAMELRTETVQTLFSNIKRVVRDLSKQLNKPVTLKVYGEDLEIDRNLIEKLEEPLIHLVRNSLDHGLETAEEREKAGKDVQGIIYLGAERLGNTIVITIGDDGRGLNREKILAKAVEKGFVRSEAAETMTDAQVHGLIFASGFSTRDSIDLISGRGVGMDIVRTAVTANRGRIEIDTQRGKFTRFHLSFPLSTAIIDGMVTRIGENLFILPISSVIESMKVLPSMIQTVNGKVEMINLRGEVILVLRMHDLLDVTPPPPEQMLIGIIVETSDKRRFMFLVDEVIAKREVVIKTLGSRFKNMKGVTSGTVLGGGKIGLVLDVDQIVELSLLEAGA